MDESNKKKDGFRQESVMLPVSSSNQLHLRRIYQNAQGIPVFLMPGMAEDGHIFYSNAGHGLAFFLARAGCDVYIADMRGKGRSWPHINKYSDFGHHEVITEDIPAYIKAIQKRRGDTPQLWIGHSWGGVMLASYLARYSQSEVALKGLVYFGTRRRLHVETLRKRLIIDLLWTVIGGKIAQLKGYFPSRQLRLGLTNESLRSYRDCTQWMLGDAWIDSVDQFNYGEAIKKALLPPSLYFGSKADTLFGHVDDMRYFLSELASHDGRMIVLGRECGNPRDYGHVEMLLHPGAVEDHFQTLLDWLIEIDQRPFSKEKSQQTFVGVGC